MFILSIFESKNYQKVCEWERSIFGSFYSEWPEKSGADCIICKQIVFETNHKLRFYEKQNNFLSTNIPVNDNNFNISFITLVSKYTNLVPDCSSSWTTQSNIFARPSILCLGFSGKRAKLVYLFYKKNLKLDFHLKKEIICIIFELYTFSMKKYFSYCVLDIDILDACNYMETIMW